MSGRSTTGTSDSGDICLEELRECFFSVAELPSDREHTGQGVNVRETERRFFLFGQTEGLSVLSSIFWFGSEVVLQQDLRQISQGYFIYTCVH